MSRILIHEPRQNNDEGCPLLTISGDVVVVCRDRESLVGALASDRTNVLVYVVKDPVEDLGLLTQLRRVAPMLPIILLGGPSDLAFRRTIQELRPTYYGVFPLEGSELGDAVRGALRRGAVRGY